MLHGRIIGGSERFMKAGATPNPQRGAWKLLAGGGSRTLRRKVWPVRIIPTALEAMGRLRLDFGADDLAVRPDGSAVVFEVNVQPGIKKRKIAGSIARAFVWASTHQPPPAVKDGAKQPKSFAHPAILRGGE